MKFILQTIAVTRYLLSTWRYSWGGVITTVLGFILVSGTIVVTLNMASGISRMWSKTGSEDIAIVLSTSAFSELNSRIPLSVVDSIRQAPGLDENKYAIQPELVGTTTLFKRSNNKPVTVLIRGIINGDANQEGKLRSGRRFVPGTNELVVGSEIASQMQGIALGENVRVGTQSMKVVGILKRTGSLADTEIRGDATVIAAALGAPYEPSVVRVSLNNAEAYPEFVAYMESLPGLDSSIARESELYERQGARFREIILVPGTFIVILMAAAACLGAVNTLHSAVLRRLRELATMRAIGFTNSPLVVGLLVEAGLLALFGAVVGAVLAGGLISNMTLVTSTGLHAMAFKVSISPLSVAFSLILSVAVGMAGGMWPAFSATRKNVVEALRAS